MSRQSNYYEQAISLCKKEIKDAEELIATIKRNLPNMEDFNTSFLGKAIRQFCEEYANGTFNAELLTKIEKMLKSPELNPYKFAIDYDGSYFITSYQDFGYPSTEFGTFFNSKWFMFYYWDNYDIDKDIEKIQKKLQKAEKDVEKAKTRLCNAEAGLSKFHDLLYSATDISNLDKVAEYATTITITQPEGNTFNTIAIIQKCMKDGIPVTISYGDKKQEIDIRDTEFTVEDRWDYYERPMRYGDDEMTELD